jgi:SAM-dependent methyltransferase
MTPRFEPAPSQWLEAWSKAAGEEVGFWEWWLRTKGGGCGFMAEDYRQRLDPQSPLQDVVTRRLSGPAAILDVGAGPLTFLGKCAAYPIEITAVDPLADHYNRLLRELKVTPLVETQAIFGEELTSHFPLNHFDITFARNALDRSASPVCIIDQMLAVTRPGGWVGLEHHFAEGTRNGTGLHQWDFLLDHNMECIVERPGGDHAVNLNARYKGLVEIQTEVRQNYTCWCSVWMKKLAAS